MNLLQKRNSPTNEPTNEPSNENNEEANFVILNEIVAKSDVTDDWIEIFNEGSVDIDISGVGLVDDIETDAPWLFPEGTTIAAGEFVLISLSDGTGEDTQGDVNSSFHATFKLSKDGETVYLMDTENTVLSKSFPALAVDNPMHVN